jgi:hypothetical protein
MSPHACILALFLSPIFIKGFPYWQENQSLISECAFKIEDLTDKFIFGKKSRGHDAIIPCDKNGKIQNVAEGAKVH